jgi:hypothetical protein
MKEKERKKEKINGSQQKRSTLIRFKKERYPSLSQRKRKKSSFSTKMAQVDVFITPEVAGKNAQHVWSTSLVESAMMKSKMQT